MQTDDQAPIPMLLFCPQCGEQHVDAEQSEADYQNLMRAWSLNAEPQDRVPVRWTNPPHRSHECQFCGWVWRPADVPTNGVAAIETKGKRDGSARPRYYKTAHDFEQSVASVTANSG